MYPWPCSLVGEFRGIVGQAAMQGFDRRPSQVAYVVGLFPSQTILPGTFEFFRIVIGCMTRRKGVWMSGTFVLERHRNDGSFWRGSNPSHVADRSGSSWEWVGGRRALGGVDVAWTPILLRSLGWWRVEQVMTLESVSRGSPILDEVLGAHSGLASDRRKLREALTAGFTGLPEHEMKSSGLPFMERSLL